MRSKNAKGLSAAESAYVTLVKSLDCGVCNQAGPSDAHHIKQGQHYTVIPLCKDCHQGAFNGLHGQARMWKILKKDEMSVLNSTIKSIFKEAKNV